MCMRYASIAILLLALGQIAVAEEDSKTAANPEVEVDGATIGRMGDPVAENPEEIHFTRAENRLWRENHLKNISKPGRLYYEFHKAGSYEPGFDDSVYLDILKINDDGSKDTNLEFLSGSRRQPVSPANLEGVKGNPVLGIYMQGDVYEMNRLTNGSWRYFQRRIKTAFARKADVKPVTFKFNGDEVKGEKITVKPYLDDPHRSQFGKFAGKTYEFILSGKVPGSIYQIKTVVPDKSNPDGEPLLLEELTFQHADFKS